MTDQRGQISGEQYGVLVRPLNRVRVAKRKQGGKNLSYLESWDVRAHLIRVFGFGNFDVETLDQYLVGTREYQSPPNDEKGIPAKDMIEAIWFAKVRLTVRDEFGATIAVYTESAVGATSGPANMIGEHHDNAVKTAASDALKRCAINLGTQFGLSLYDNGSLVDVVKRSLVIPEGYQPEATDEEAKGRLEQSLGATEVTDEAPAEAAEALATGERVEEESHG